MAATNPLTYNDYVTQLGNLAVENVQAVGGVVQGVNTYFTTLIPQALNYAELRIQRDVDLLPLQTSTSYIFTAGNNLLSVPVDDFVTIQTVAVNDSGTAYTPLLPVSKEWLQNVYNDPSSTNVPRYFAMYGGDKATAGQATQYVMVGPVPASNYPVRIIGTQRAPSLYKLATNPEASTEYTFISTWLPDLLLQASMIFVAQYQRQFGATGNAPEMPGSYENQYQNLLKGALVEEARKKFQASGWSAMSPPLVATAGR